MNDTFTNSLLRKDVLTGLTASPKYLLSKYFYDDRGDALFQQIMDCPEYYLTRAEADILRQQSRQMLQRCVDRHASFELVELGAGDGSKTIFLLRQALQLRCSQRYYPIDISPSVLVQLTSALSPQLPGMHISGLPGEYLVRLGELQQISNQPKLVLFLGATIGNMLPPEAIEFFRQLRSLLRSDDLVLTGFDLRKDPQTILDAYSDKQGLTKAFNLNLLGRINRELGANFQPDQFRHFPVYDPVTGSCKSYLISTCPQQVRFNDDTIVDFEANEPVYMEVSQKYSEAEIQQLALTAGYEPVDAFFDSRRQFTDVLWRVPQCS